MTDHPTLPVKTPAEPEPNTHYRGFTYSVTDQQAFDRFIALYGCPPQQICRWQNVLWVGPIPSEALPEPRP